MDQTEGRDLLERSGPADDVRHVVVGVDDSVSGRGALLWALREAHARGVPLLALRAWTPGYEVLGEDGPRLAERMSDQGRAALEFAQQDLDLAVARTGLSDGQQTARATAGQPADVLLEAGYDALIVVGSRGTGLLGRHVLGSTAARVLHHARSPVVVVPPELPGTRRRAPRVLVGVDHSPASLHALAVAAASARRHGHPLVPVSVQPLDTEDLSGLGAYLSDPVAEREAATSALWAAVAAAGAGDVVTDPEVAVGHAGRVLTTLAQPQDLLVVGSRGRGGVGALLLGSTSTSCAQHATCPVMVVR